ncbi:hypothetical protein [Prosthecochloris sp.]|uniref:hypothetical protein n=1 Tax=Prosthecochloris sp. TaxID=290513 RepID=UPI002580B3D5|nr:hypothetical protein [Prosthecochloris sp.]
MLARNILKSAGNNQLVNNQTSISYLDNSVHDDVLHDVYTAFNMSFGEVDSDRFIIVTVHAMNSSPNVKITGVTVGGVSATVLASSDDAIGYDYGETAIYWAQPSGSSGNIAVNFSNDVLTAGVGVFRMITDDITPYDTGAEESPNESLVTFDINVPQGGAVIAASQAVNQGSCTWQEGIEAFDVDPRTGENASAMYINNYSGDGTVTVDNNEASSLCAVSWV